MNPFRYGQVVLDKDFCPRPELEKILAEYINSAQNVLIEGEEEPVKPLSFTTSCVNWKIFASSMSISWK